MPKRQFTITVTSPFVDTASGSIDGEIFSGDFRDFLKANNIDLDNKMINSNDYPKLKELRGDLLGVIFTFTVPPIFTTSLCKHISNEIIECLARHKSIPEDKKYRILVEYETNSSIIFVSKGKNEKLLEDEIRKIIN